MKSTLASIESTHSDEIKRISSEIKSAAKRGITCIKLRVDHLQKESLPKIVFYLNNNGYRAYLPKGRDGRPVRGIPITINWGIKP